MSTECRTTMKIVKLWKKRVSENRNNLRGADYALYILLRYRSQPDAIIIGKLKRAFPTKTQSVDDIVVLLSGKKIPPDRTNYFALRIALKDFISCAGALLDIRICRDRFGIRRRPWYASALNELISPYYGEINFGMINDAFQVANKLYYELGGSPYGL